MALPTSGTISFSDINTMLGLTAGTATDLNNAQLRVVAGITTPATTIAMNNLYGRQLAGSNWYSSTSFGAHLATGLYYVSGTTWACVGLLVGAGNNTSYVTGYSTDNGVSWTWTTLASPIAGLTAVVYHAPAGLYLASGWSATSNKQAVFSCSTPKFDSGVTQVGTFGYAATPNGTYANHIASNGTYALCAGVSAFLSGRYGAYSADGTTWTVYASAVGLTAVKKFVWVAPMSKWYAVTGTPRYNANSDGTGTWTAVTAITGNTGAVDLAYGSNGTFLMIDTYGSGTSRAFRSTDGINFTQTTTFNSQALSIAYANGVWLITTQSSTGSTTPYGIWASYDDGVTFSNVYSTTNMYSSLGAKSDGTFVLSCQMDSSAGTNFYAVHSNTTNT